MSGQTTMRAAFRVGSIHQPTSLPLSATNEASATGECPCVHQSSLGREEGGEWRVLCEAKRPKVDKRRLENGARKPVLTSRNSKRRLQDIPKCRRARHREEGALSESSVGVERMKSLLPE